MPEQDYDKRLDAVLGMIARIAALDFSRELETSPANDMMDAIALGLNMLSEELESQVVAKSKLKEVNEKLEEFASVTAHDLKSPLNSQTGLINLLEHCLDAEENAEAFEYISRLKKMNNKMKCLVEGILEYSRTCSLEISNEVVDLNVLLKEVLETDNICKRASVTVESKLPKVWFTTTGGVQVIRNIIDNAIKYCDKPKCKITVKARELHDHYQISIADNGPGIDASYHEKIFDLFTKVHPYPKENSEGIGLATVKKIIESQKGRIWVESSTGNGASFIFTLKKVL